MRHEGRWGKEKSIFGRMHYSTEDLGPNVCFTRIAKQSVKGWAYVGRRPYDDRESSSARRHADRRHTFLFSVSARTNCPTVGIPPFRRMVEHVLGDRALQVGMPLLDTLRANGMKEHWFLLSDSPSEREEPLREDWRLVAALPEALPFANETFDLVVLPHSLDFSPAPQQLLAEAVRVLAPEAVSFWRASILSALVVASAVRSVRMSALSPRRHHAHQRSAPQGLVRSFGTENRGRSLRHLSPGSSASYGAQPLAVAR